MHPSKDDTNATKRKDLVHHFSASTANPNLFVFMEDIISDYYHATTSHPYPRKSGVREARTQGVTGNGGYWLMERRKKRAEVDSLSRGGRQNSRNERRRLARENNQSGEGNEVCQYPSHVAILVMSYAYPCYSSPTVLTTSRRVFHGFTVFSHGRR